MSRFPFAPNVPYSTKERKKERKKDRRKKVGCYLIWMLSYLDVILFGCYLFGFILVGCYFICYLYGLYLLDVT